MIKTRLYLTCGVTCLAIATASLAGCGRNNTPTGPTAGGVAPMVTTLTISGNGRLTAPGQTTQLSAQATYSDGSSKNMTSSVQWGATNAAVVTVSRGGLVTAVDFGKTTVYGTTPGISSNLVITVLPDGTYIVSGRVTEAGNLSVTDARIEVIGGPMNGRAAMTDQSGRYAFNGVAGVLQVRATKGGYVAATQNVTGDSEQVNIELAPAAPYASIGGVYRLTFTASQSCQLPDDLASRTYTATIDQAGARLTVTLSDAQFGAYFSRTWNTFSGRVLGNAVLFTLNGGYDAIYNGGVSERLTDTRYLNLAGTADATVTGSTISAKFAGTVSILTSPDNIFGPTSACAASDHHLVFTRTATATSRKRALLGSRVDAGRLVARALDVLDVGALIRVRLRLGAALAAQLEHAIAQAAQELPVVRHEQHRPVEVLERIEQHLLGRQIEVVGRLVEHQKVRRVQQHAREHEARLLAA